MSTYEQEIRALDRAHEFLMDISAGCHPLRPIRDVRTEVRRVLRHWPLGPAEVWHLPRPGQIVTETGPGAPHSTTRPTYTPGAQNGSQEAK